MVLQTQKKRLDVLIFSAITYKAVTGEHDLTPKIILRNRSVTSQRQSDSAKEFILYNPYTNLNNCEQNEIFQLLSQY